MRSSSAELFDHGADAVRAEHAGEERGCEPTDNTKGISMQVAYVLGVDWYAVTETEH